MSSNTPNRDRARSLRHSMTDAEKFVWQKLRNRAFVNYKFRRQVPLGSFIVDFVCLDRRLILELDGGQHLEQKEYDDRRTEWLRTQGFRVVRFWNDVVFKEWPSIELLLFDLLADPGKEWTNEKGLPFEGLTPRNEAPSP